MPDEDRRIRDIARTISEDVAAPVTEAKIDKSYYPDDTIPGRRGYAPWKKLPKEYRDHYEKLRAAQRRYRSRKGPPRILIVSGSSRNENTCPGEKPKSLMLCESASRAIRSMGCEPRILDLSRVTVEDKMIWPCKACYSTSAALCHVGCTCYPNELRKTDWMHDEIYEMLIESHGLFIITPTNWYSMPTVLKAMIDRMVCFDAANPDPTKTMTPEGGLKDIKKAKALERGPRVGGKSIWNFRKSKVMAGRIYSVYVHGDADGLSLVQDALTQSLEWYGFTSAGPYASTSDYIGYYETYADNREHLKNDPIPWENVRIIAKNLAEKCKKAKKKGMPMPVMSVDPR